MSDGLEWTVSVVAGTGEQGYSGDGSSALDARLNNPFDLAFTPDGSLIFSDTFNHCIRRVDAVSGVIWTICGTGEWGFSGDGGAATDARLNEPYGVVVDRSGRVFFADRLNRRVRVIDATGVVSTLAGDGSGVFSGDGGEPVAAGLVEPNGLALDPAQTRLLIADVAGHRVRVVDLASGTIDTFAGVGEGRHDGDGGPAVRAGVFGARAVAFAPDGSVYVMERQGSCIRQVRDGVITTVAGTGARGYAGDGGDARLAVFNAPKNGGRRSGEYLCRGHGKPRDTADRCGDADRNDHCIGAGPSARSGGGAGWQRAGWRQRAPPDPAVVPALDGGSVDAGVVTVRRRLAA